jgi:hypothetical protein
MKATTTSITQSGSTTSTVPPLTIYLTRGSDGNIEFPTSIPAGLTVTKTQLPNKTTPEANKITITGIDKPLKDVMIFGYSNTSWLSASAKLNSGSTSILMSDASGNPIRSSKSRSQPGAFFSIKLPLTSVISTLKISGLEQGNFPNFSAGGDKSNGGSNIKIQLFF